MTGENPVRRTNRKYIFVFILLILINMLPLIAEKPYRPQDTQDVIINLLMVALNPYKVYGPVFHVATLLLAFGLLWRPAKMGRPLAVYIGLNFLVIAAAQSMGQTQKYGFVVHLAALMTMVLLAIIWLAVAYRDELHPIFRRPSIPEWGLILLALLSFWSPYAITNGMIQPDFNPLLLLTSPDYGLAFCFTTPVFLMALILIYPHVNQFTYRVTAFCGLLYGLFNLTHWFNPNTQWMGFLHLPLLVISVYALILPGLQARSRSANQFDLEPNVGNKADKLLLMLHLHGNGPSF